MKKYANHLKAIIATILALTSIIGLSGNAFAQESTSRQEYSYSALSDVSRVISGGTITINGNDNSLYRVFESQQEAIADIKTKIPNLLNTLAEEYSLSELSDSNWGEYRDAMYMLFDSDNRPADYNESNAEFSTLRAFFDIYENKEKNDKIIQLYESSIASSAKNVLNQELGILLPYTEPLAQETIEQIRISQSRAPINVSDAIDYATEYATSPNTPTYYYFSNGDCTNFISQILENAGVDQVVYDSEYSGWWHKRTSGFLGIGYTHTHSRSWTMADTFCRYMGVCYTTTSNGSFAANIQAGSIIAADFESDGDWDHMGFVTQRDNYIGSYGYYDYKVAQHTSNYHAWASLSTNGWDNIGTNGGTCARVRN